MNPAQHILVGLARGYQVVVSPVLTAVLGSAGFGCRFQPTCSHYALEAVRQHGAWQGARLAVRRLCRCHPWGGSGADPVPPKSMTPTAPALNPSRHGS